MRQLTIMVKGATFIWASISKSVGKNGDKNKTIAKDGDTPKDTMQRQLNRWDL